ncbi:MAG: 5-guanidino-2-oxopentanoate decarboxylase [Proteobacteria bacterium]|nr:5-guanidino-2-oxopentanoate decarboxylase [Pseudomonadota bacterium]
MKTLGQYLIEALTARGVRHVFGIPGVHNLELYRGLARSPIRHVSGRHEQGLGFMADGYARVSGRPGVCFTITGPGVTNILTAMGQAYGDSVAMLVISSQNRRGEAGSGRGFLHELPDQRAMAAGVACATFAIGAPAELPAALVAAFEIFRSARPRPVYIEIPLDVLAQDSSGLALPSPVRQAPRADGTALQAAATRLFDARRPVILAGGGAVRAAALVLEVAQRLDAPVVMTANARGIVPSGHALAVPCSPTLEPVRELIAAADCVLAVGTEIGPTDYDAYGMKEFPNPPGLVRIDIDPAQLNRSARAAVALCGDAAQALQGIIDALAARAASNGAAPNQVRRAEGARRAAACREAALAAIRQISPALEQHVQVLDMMRDTLPQALLVGDSTQLVYGGNLGFNTARAGSWFNSATGYGTLGYALPAATGASLADPQRPVICLVGDGGVQFSLAELAVPGEAGAWVAIVVWNNRGYGEIRTAMIAAGIDPEGVDVAPPDFAQLARAYGYTHHLIRSRAALRAALASFGARRQVVLLEIDAAHFT